MSVPRAYAGIEGYRTVEDKAERYQQRSIDKIAAQVVKAAEGGQSQYEVRGGWLDMFRTTYEPDVYAGVADRLAEREEPIEIEATRLKGQKHSSETPNDSVLLEAETIYVQDVITIQAIGGKAIEHEPYHGPERQDRLYPPSPEDLDGQHNLAMMG